MKICKKCDVTGIFDAIFCHKCGKEMLDLPICKCGNSIGDWSKFCSVCGEKNKNYKE
jgi:hypothetical protein